MMKDVRVPEPASSSNFTEAEFRELVQQWLSDTAVLSSLEERILHPAYQQIIRMGPAVLPHLLGELARRPIHWFWALKSIARVDPAPEGADFDEAVEAWLAWGRRRGLID